MFNYFEDLRLHTVHATLSDTPIIRVLLRPFFPYYTSLNENRE